MAVSPALAQPGPAPAGTPPGNDALVLVVPLTNLTGDPVDDWIGVGIAEAVAIDLQMGGARVVRATAALPDTAGPDGALEAGREAGAGRVVGGAYQRLGDQLRVTARLVDVSDGAVLRSATVTGIAGDIFELQDRVAAELRGGAELARALPEPAPAPPRAPALPPPARPELPAAGTAPGTPSGRRGPFGRPGPPPRVEASAGPSARVEAPPTVAPVAETATFAAPGAAGLPAVAAAGVAVDAGLIDGPPAPLPPAVMTRDEEGRTTVRADPPRRRHPSRRRARRAGLRDGAGDHRLHPAGTGHR